MNIKAEINAIRDRMNIYNKRQDKYYEDMREYLQSLHERIRVLEMENLSVWKRIAKFLGIR